MDFDPQLEFWLFASFPWWLGGGDIEKISLLGLALSCINEIDCSLLDTDDFLSSHLLLDSVSTIFENPFFIDVLWPVTSSLYDAFKSFLLVLSMLDLLIVDFIPVLSSFLAKGGGSQDTLRSLHAEAKLFGFTYEPSL